MEVGKECGNLQDWWVEYKIIKALIRSHFGYNVQFSVLISLLKEEYIGFRGCLVKLHETFVGLRELSFEAV